MKPAEAIAPVVAEARGRLLVSPTGGDDEVLAAAEEAGLASLWTDGVAKVEAGSISLEELRRTVPR
jgi:type II secretory ATPase GspE/PulE/Tfp pilus assembly ATPase PilB-like protein